jgi:hypothetical protein
MAEEKTTMTKRMGTMMAIATAIVLMGAGIAHAKSHEDGNGHGHGAKGKGHGVSHGKSGKHGDGTGPGSGDNGSSNRGHGNGGKGSGKGGGHGGGGGACDPVASSVIGAFVDSTCPCDGVDDGMGGTVAWKNHGQYVRCVTHAVKDATRAAGVKRRCARDIVPCAARSSCGKRNAVTCIVTTTGTCLNGACDTPDAAPCTTDADCGGQTCGVTSAARCSDAGGTAGSGSCCTASPNGAFLD